MTREAASGKIARPRRKVTKTSPDHPARLIARIWHGQTPARRADEYTRYLYEAGIRKIAAIPGNRGVQMLRVVHDDVAEFEVLSYWDSIDAIKRFAGADYENVRHLPRDPEYMVGTEPAVRHFEVIVNDWPPP
ncbi:MAG: antibiotic biosynthesis monooxygenase family protein [Alphaproteobacteria bacterium]